MDIVVQQWLRWVVEEQEDVEKGDIAKMRNVFEMGLFNTKPPPGISEMAGTREL